MDFKKSKFAGLSMLSLPFFIFGVMAFVAPEAIEGNISKENGLYLLIGGIAVVSSSYLLYFLSNAIHTWFFPSGIIRQKTFSEGIEMYLGLGCALLFGTVLVFFLPFVLHTDSVGFRVSIGFGKMFFIFAWIAWIVLLFVKLFNMYQSIKLKQVAQTFASEFSFSISTEKEFVFPTKYFPFGKYGVAEYVLEKTISGIQVRIFQYVQTQRQGKRIFTQRYAVTQIILNKQLPRFSLYRARDAQGPALFGMQYTLPSAIGFDKENESSSKIELTVSDGDLYYLNIAKEFEIEALQIFTQDIVEKIASKWPHLRIFGEDTFLIAMNTKTMRTREDFEYFSSFVHFLVTEIAVHLDPISRSVEAVEEVVNFRKRTQ